MAMWKLGGTSREDEMAKPSRWNVVKRYQIAKEALSQKEPTGQIARRHQVTRSKLADAIQLNDFDR